MTNSQGFFTPGVFTMKERKLYTVANGLPSDDVSSCAVYGGSLIVSTAAGMCSLKDGKIKLLNDSPAGKLVACADGRLYFLCGCGIYTLAKSRLRKIREFDSPVKALASDGEIMWIVTENELYRTNAEMDTDTLVRELEGGKGKAVAAKDGVVYVVTDEYVSIVHGKRMEWKNLSPEYVCMPACRINSASFDSNGFLWLSTENGAAIFDGHSLWLTADKIRTLPENEIFMTEEGPDGARYFASECGVIRTKDGHTDYFSADRYVPDSKINDIAVLPGNSGFAAATGNGLSVITFTTMTFEKKAEKYEEIIEKYHIRRGFTATCSTPDMDYEKGKPDISDNDGLWTACYVAAESLRYAATKDDSALAKARRGKDALLHLMKVTGLPGFTARAVRYPGDDGYGDGDGEWHASPVEKDCEWKGETSSDEMTGHYFGLSVYFDLCADKKEKDEIKKYLLAVTDHIIGNNYRLIDEDGLPTTWACWNPALLNYDDKWFPERGINSLELLGFLKVSAHISGEKKYEKLYNEFVKDHHYALNAMQHKIRDARECHIDDDLGFLASFTLLRLEDDPAVRSFILCGLEDHWQYEKPENQPLFAVVHAVFTGRDDGLSEGLRSLREMPFDMCHYDMKNENRKNIVIDEEHLAKYGETKLLVPLPFDERNIHRPDASVYNLTERHRRKHAMEPTVWLLPYWTARYYGLISEDTK